MSPPPGTFLNGPKQRINQDILNVLATILSEPLRGSPLRPQAAISQPSRLPTQAPLRPSPQVPSNHPSEPSRLLSSSPSAAPTSPASYGPLTEPESSLTSPSMASKNVSEPAFVEPTIQGAHFVPSFLFETVKPNLLGASPDCGLDGDSKHVYRNSGLTSDDDCTKYHLEHARFPKYDRLQHRPPEGPLHALLRLRESPGPPLLRPALPEAPGPPVYPRPRPHFRLQA